MFLNLLLNAVAATPPEGRVSLRAAAEGDWLTVEVEDEGGGLPALVQDRLSGAALPPAEDVLAWAGRRPEAQGHPPPHVLLLRV